MATASPYFQILRKKEPKNKNFHRFERKLKKEPQHIVQDILQEQNWSNSNLLAEAISNGAPESTVLDLIKRNPDLCNTKDFKGNRPIFLAMGSKTCATEKVLTSIMKHLPKTFFKQQEFVGKMLIIGLKNKYCSSSMIRYWVNNYPTSASFASERYKKTPLQVAIEEKRCVVCIHCLIDTFPEAVRFPNVACMLPLQLAVFMQCKLPIIQALYESFPEAMQLPVRINKTKFKDDEDGDDDDIEDKEEDGNGDENENEKDEKKSQQDVDVDIKKGRDNVDMKHGDDVSHPNKLTPREEEDDQEENQEENKTLASAFDLNSLTSSLLSSNKSKNGKMEGDNIIHLALQRRCDYDVVMFLLKFTSSPTSSSKADPLVCSISLRQKDKHGTYPLHLAIMNNRGWEMTTSTTTNLNKAESIDNYLNSKRKTTTHFLDNSERVRENICLSTQDQVSRMLCTICDQSVGKKKSALSPVLLKHSSGKTTFQLAIENAAPESFLLHMLDMEPSAATVAVDNGELPLFLAFKHVPRHHQLFFRMLEIDPSVPSIMLRKNKPSEKSNHPLSSSSGSAQQEGLKSNQLPKIRKTKSIALSMSTSLNHSSSSAHSSISSRRRLSRTLSSPVIEQDGFEQATKSAIDELSLSSSSRSSFDSRQSNQSVSSSHKSLRSQGSAQNKQSSSTARRKNRSPNLRKDFGNDEKDQESSSHLIAEKLEVDSDFESSYAESSATSLPHDELFVTSALHEALRYGQGSEVCKFIKLSLSKTPPSFLLKKDSDGSLPLHLALNNTKLSHNTSSFAKVSLALSSKISPKNNMIKNEVENMSLTKNSKKSCMQQSEVPPYKELLTQLILICPHATLQLDKRGQAPYHIALLRRAPPDIIQLLATKAPQFVLRTSQHSSLPGMSAHTSMLSSFSKGPQRKPHDLAIIARNLPKETWTNRYDEKPKSNIA